MAVATIDKTDEQKAITDMVRQFADEQILPNAEHYDHEDEFPEPIVEQMKELGLFGVTIPEEYGGMGLDLTTYSMIVEELSRGWISISGIVNTHFIGSYLLMKFGSDEQKEKYLPQDGDRRDPRRLLALRARAGLRRPGHQDRRQEDRRRRLRDQRPEDVGHQRPDVDPGVRAGQDRPRRRSAPQGHDLLHRREGARRAREHRRLRGLHRPAQAEEDGLQGRRVHRARLRRLPLPRRQRARRRGGGPEQGLLADDGRARGRPRERGGPRRGDRPARPGAGPALLAGAQDLRQADRPAPGDPVQARRHGHPGGRRPAA